MINLVFKQIFSLIFNKIICSPHTNCESIILSSLRKTSIVCQPCVFCSATGSSNLYIVEVRISPAAGSSISQTFCKAASLKCRPAIRQGLRLELLTGSARPTRESSWEKIEHPRQVEKTIIINLPQSARIWDEACHPVEKYTYGDVAKLVSSEKKLSDHGHISPRHFAHFFPPGKISSFFASLY